MPIASLNIALSGLQAAQQLIDTASRNVANAQTPGYVRKDQQAITNVVGGGVLTSDITRQVNQSLLFKERINIGAQSYGQTLTAALDQINQLSNNPDSELTLAARIQELGNAFQQFAANPQDQASANAVLASADVLAKTFNDQANELIKLQADAKASIADAIPDVNTQLQKIATLNGKVLEALGKGDDPTDLEDLRDNAVRDIAKLIDVRTFVDAKGVLNVYSADYKPLAGEYADVLTYDPTNGRISTSTGILGNLGSAIGANQQIANQTTVNRLQQLDELATTLANAFSALPAGTPPGAGIQLFTQSNGTAAPAAPPLLPPWFAADISVNPAYVANPTQAADRLRVGDAAVNALAPGQTIPASSNTASVLAQNLLTTGVRAYSTPGIAGTSTFVQAATAITVGAGQELSQAKAQLATDQSFGTQITQTIAATSEVNIDQEFSNIVQLQNLYAANARVVSTTQKILDDLLSLVS